MNSECVRSFQMIDFVSYWYFKEFKWCASRASRRTASLLI